MNFAASEWEFRYRFWIFASFYWICFSLYRIDHTNLGLAVTRFFYRDVPGAVTYSTLRPVYLAGVSLAVLAALIRTWATAYIRPEVMTDGELHTHTVIAEGPYRYVLNPLYLGTNLMAFVYAVLASRLGALVLASTTMLFNYRIILREERELALVQGENYERFRRAVPRLLPSLHPHVSGSERKPNWGAGLLGEMFFWGLALALLVFALTFNARAYFLALGLTFGIYFLCLGLIGRLRQTRP